jgi:nicotinamide-nucleotide amidase
MVPARRRDGTSPDVAGSCQWRDRLVRVLGYPQHVGDRAGKRHILTAEVLSVGTELTVGETRDTNGTDIARFLARHGVMVTRISALPDDLDVVRGAFAQALDRADLVVSTGGLGPTPDDLTREAIADLLGETAVVDHELEAWLRDLWQRRELPFVDANLKQAWLIPSALAIPNPNGTAPGWWVEVPHGGLIVALPGPPREMRPMWSDWVEPRLVSRGLGRDAAVRTLRTTGIGESLVVDRLGDDIMRSRNPIVTTYARQEAVDVRIAAGSPTDAGVGPDRTATDLADDMERRIRDRIEDHVWGRDDETWADAIDRLLGASDWRLATIEAATGGALAGLLAGCGRLAAATSLADAASLVGSDQTVQNGDNEDSPADRLEAAARRARVASGADVGLALVARNRGDDTAVSMAVVTPVASHRERRIVFLGGAQGRLRAAIAGAAILHTTLRRLGNVPIVDGERPAHDVLRTETEVSR